MGIEKLIDREVCYLSILEEMYEVGKWLAERPYFAVVDERLEVVGIITGKDFQLYPHHLVIDASIDKPRLSPAQSIFEAAKVMLASGHFYLPVFEGQKFIGVISIMSVVQALIENKVSEQV